jgi:hypothetical protein
MYFLHHVITNRWVEFGDHSARLATNTIGKDIRKMSVSATAAATTATTATTTTTTT